MRGSIWPFQFGLPRDIEQAEAKTTKDQTILKRTEPAFIEPMQCKPVTALPAGEKWTFEIKFDGYRCIAVKRGRRSRYSRATRRCSTGASPESWMPSPRSRATSFSTENWSPWIRKGDLPFSFCKTTCLASLPVYFYAFDLLNRNGETLVNLPIRTAPRVAGQDRLPRPRIRYASLRYCRRHPASS